MSKRKSKKTAVRKSEKISPSKLIELFAKKLQVGELSAEENETIGRYYLTQAPRKIYRYRPEHSREIEALVEHKIWFSRLQGLNDPFEFNARVDVKSLAMSENDTRSQLQAMSFAQQQQSHFKQISKELDYDSFYKEIIPGFTVACFSEIKDSLLMWGHYSTGHRGMCAEYDIIDINSISGKTVIPVNYSKTLPALTSTDDTTLHRFTLNMMSTKFTDWKYEREWRCIQDIDACGKNLMPNGALLDSPPPTAIYLGCNAYGEFVESITCTCKDVLKIPLYRMTKSRDEYKLLPERIL